MKTKNFFIVLFFLILINSCVGSSTRGVFGTGVSIALDPRTLGTQIDDSIMEKNLQTRLALTDKKYLIKIIEDCIKLKCFSLGFNIKLINKKIIQICLENKFKITVYSDKSIFITEALKLWNLGVDSIFVDNPVNYKKIINNL